VQAEACYTEAFPLERVHKAATSHSTGALLREMQAALKGEASRVEALRSEESQLAGTATAAGAAAMAAVLEGLHALVAAKLQVRIGAPPDRQICLSRQFRSPARMHSRSGRARVPCSLARRSAFAV
jgi:hypothetical protein